MQGGPGADTFQEGAGRDVVGYCDSANPLAGVTITLDGLANDGSALEGDNVGAGIDQVSGCDAADQLTGNAGANELAGAGGDDVIDGGAGNDLINGGGGSDNLFGGDGNDTITAWEPAVLPTRADQVSCGPGVDTADVDTLDIVDSTCETITFLGGAPLGPGPGGAGAGVGAAAPGAGRCPALPPTSSPPSARTPTRPSRGRRSTSSRRCATPVAPPPPARSSSSPSRDELSRSAPRSRVRWAGYRRAVDWMLRPCSAMSGPFPPEAACSEASRFAATRPQRLT